MEEHSNTDSSTNPNESDNQADGRTCVEKTLNCQTGNVESKLSSEVDLSQSTPESSTADSQNLLESDNSSSESLECEHDDTNVNGDVVSEVTLLRQKNKELQLEISRLEKENARLEADRCPELHQLQLETLEKTILQQKQDVKRLQDSLERECDSYQKQTTQLKQDYEIKLDRLKKQYDVAKKEKESMVMKYAVSEKSVIDLKREIQSYDNKIREAMKDKELAQTKMKNIAMEKTKLNQILDAKNLEITRLERENSKQKDEIVVHESKVKMAMSRMKTEMEYHTETQGKLEKLQQKFNETQAIIKSYQEAQEDKTNQEQEQKAKLIIDKHDEETAAKLQLELDNFKKRQQNLVEENNFFKIKIQTLEKGRFDYEEKIGKLMQCMDSQKQTIADLQTQLTEFESVSMLLQKERERLAASQIEIQALHSQISDLQQEVEGCKGREAELLDFTQKLTEKNVRLQSEYTAMEARAKQLDIEHSSCTSQISQLTADNSNLREELNRETSERTVEKESLSSNLKEQTKKAESLSQEVADQQWENQLLKKKHLVTLKELTKELQVCRKKLETYENSPGQPFVNESRTSSDTSLNIIEGVENRMLNSQPSVATVLPNQTEPDRQVLINKIVKIQKSNAKKTEKIEFLEEHVQQLVTELQKKTRIIQNYIVREQSGALSSESMDQNKMALSKHGGIMASVYNSRAVDEGMTLELSLEINQKLQAVLEDTLLKNITLKENMETLGNEIAKLTASKPPQIES